jgi:hypothetical protein
MNTFIKDGTTDSIYLEDIIPNKIVNSLSGCSFTVKNLNVATDWTDAKDKIKNYTPYIDFYDVSSGNTENTMLFTTKDYAYDKYFDYCDLIFSFNDESDLKYFETKNQYINYTLYDRLNQIDSIVFNSGVSFFNSYILSGFSYQYTDKNRIKIISSVTGLTDIFKPYTYVYAFSSPGEKTLVYSVKDHEIIIEKPAKWSNYNVITSIQNIDGLKNISDILYEVYLNESYDWYIHKSDNERRYISSAYGEILSSSDIFRNNVTGLLYENNNNEFILKLYKITDENNNFIDPNLYYKAIELVFIGSDGKSRLPVPLNSILNSNNIQNNIISGETIYLYDWNILIDTDDYPSGEVFDDGLNSVVPVNTPALLYNVINGGLNSV